MMTRINEVGQSFDQVAKHYEQAAVVQNEIGQRLFERLDYLKIQPKRILDLGCGVGQFSQALKKRFPKAQVVGIDLSCQMLNMASRKQGWLSKWGLVGGDITAIPFDNEAFDLIFSNQVVHWAHDTNQLLSELHRVMAVNGCVLFSTLGPDTFKELKTVFANIDAYAHVNVFQDMHDIGDSLLQQQFLDPVMDMEFLTVHYSSVKDLLTNLKQQGVRNINPKRKPGLSGRHYIDTIIKQYEPLLQQGKVPLTYEVVYGHAWRGESKSKTVGNETFISLQSIRRI